MIETMFWFRKHNQIGPEHALVIGQRERDIQLFSHKVTKNNQA